MSFTRITATTTTTKKVVATDEALISSNSNNKKRPRDGDDDDDDFEKWLYEPTFTVSSVCPKPTAFVATTTTVSVMPNPKRVKLDPKIEDAIVAAVIAEEKEFGYDPALALAATGSDPVSKNNAAIKQALSTWIARNIYQVICSDTEQVRVNYSWYFTTFKRGDLARLKPEQFIDDTVLLFLIDNLLEYPRINPTQKNRRVERLPTHFYSMLTTVVDITGRAKRRQILNVDTLDRLVHWLESRNTTFNNKNPVDYIDTLLVPIHCSERGHWAMAVVNFKDKQICYYDSHLNDVNDGLSVTAHLRFFLNYYAERTRKNEDDLKILNFADGSWKPDFIPTDPLILPQQENLTDCCLFAYLYARHAAFGRPTSDLRKINQEVVHYMRILAANEIATRTVLLDDCI